MTEMDSGRMFRLNHVFTSHDAPAPARLEAFEEMLKSDLFKEQEDRWICMISLWEIQHVHGEKYAQPVRELKEQLAVYLLSDDQLCTQGASIVVRYVDNPDLQQRAWIAFLEGIPSVPDLFEMTECGKPGFREKAAKMLVRTFRKAIDRESISRLEHGAHTRGWEEIVEMLKVFTPLLQQQ